MFVVSDSMLQDSAKNLLLQLQYVVSQCSDEDFVRPLSILSGSTFGQHVRHTLEFFICLFDASATESVNYDNRKHDQVIESDKALAQSVIKDIMQFIEVNNNDFELSFRANYSIEGGENVSTKSSFYRELSYNIEHTIHHMALLKVAILDSIHYVNLPEHFGVASSTVRYQSHA